MPDETKRTRVQLPLVAVVAIAGLVACASAPTHQLGEAQATVTSAESVGAQQQPRAAYHLQLAKQQIAEAKPLMDGSRDDKRNAERLLVRAELDARLAMEMARTGEMQADAKQAWAEIQQLQGEGK
jgi:hypothetical protein